MRTTLLVTIIFLFSNKVISQTTDSSLNRFIYEWINVEYKWGGKTKNGVDCSQLNRILQKEVYKIDIQNTCKLQYLNSERVSKDSLREGDLIFFYSKRSPSKWHCATYIGKGSFFHASNSKTDVIISNLNDSYYVRNYRGAGRVKRK